MRKGVMTLVACAAAAMALAAMADGATSGLHGCGDKPRVFAYKVKADFSCKKAFRIVKGWHNGVKNGGEADRNVKGFRCNYRQVGYESGKIRCKTNNRKVKWITGV